MSKILFYVEPFPIRNSFIHFSGIFSNFSKALLENKTENEYYIYANAETLVALARQFPEYEEHFLLPAEEEEEFFHQFLKNWDSAGIDSWKQLMSDSAVSDQFVQLIKNLYQRRPFDYIVCWGTNYAVKKAAKELKIGFINMELGCSRPPYMDSLCMDPWGVNGASSLSQSKIKDFANIAATDAQEDLLFSDNFSPKGHEASFSYFNCSSLLDKIGEEKIAFIPLQLYDDANLLQYSPYETVEEVILDILPKLTEKGYTCVFKEHPCSPIRAGSNYANLKAKVTALAYPNVCWLTAKDSSLSNAKLYQMAEVIITVNSSAGFEALFYDKPVIVLGEAVYKVKGVFPTLQEYLNGKFNPEQYKKNIGKIRHFFLSHYLMSKEKAEDARYFFSFMKFVGDMSKEKLSTREIIERYYHWTLPEGKN